MCRSGGWMGSDFTGQRAGYEPASKRFSPRMEMSARPAPLRPR
jgi:hypothetical protein